LHATLTSEPSETRAPSDRSSSHTRKSTEHNAAQQRRHGVCLLSLLAMSHHSGATHPLLYHAEVPVTTHPSEAISITGTRDFGPTLVPLPKLFFDGPRQRPRVPCPGMTTSSTSSYSVPDTTGRTPTLRTTAPPSALTPEPHPLATPHVCQTWPMPWWSAHSIAPPPHLACQTWPMPWWSALRARRRSRSTSLTTWLCHCINLDRRGTSYNGSSARGFLRLHAPHHYA
jgi:hypothetical protein